MTRPPPCRRTSSGKSAKKCTSSPAGACRSRRGAGSSGARPGSAEFSEGSFPSAVRSGRFLVQVLLFAALGVVAIIPFLVVLIPSCASFRRKSTVVEDRRQLFPHSGNGRRYEAGTDAAGVVGAAGVRSNVNCRHGGHVTGGTAHARRQPRGPCAVHRMGGPGGAGAPQHAGEPGAL